MLLSKINFGGVEREKKGYIRWNGAFNSLLTLEKRKISKQLKQ